MTRLTLADVEAAQDVVRPYVWRTPLEHSAALSQMAQAEVYLKLECWQRTGSFKVRGALNKVAALSPREKARGLVTASAGNHGLGLALAAQALGQPHVTVFVPENAAAVKVDRLSAYGCQVLRAGTDFDACHLLAQAYASERGSLYISAYDDPQIIAGQGTAALEVLQDLPEAGLLLVPVGGGGLIAGTAVVAKAISPTTLVVGLQPEASPAALLSLRDGRPYETYPAGETICDGLAGGFGRVPFELAAALLDDLLIVTEAEVRRAVGWLLAREQLVVEGSGSIAIAPLLGGQLDSGGRPIVAILTGRNIDATLIRRILEEEPWQ